MRAFTFFLFLMICHGLMAQPDTEVYLLDIDINNNDLVIDNQRNISNNPGYDNQPFFYDDTEVIFSSTRKDQTDIAAYNVNDKTISWLSDTPGGSEYSPTKIPGKKEISSIRLDKDGKQLLYRYKLKNGKSTPILEDLVVGYHTWFNKNIIVSFVLGDEASLVVSNLRKKTNYTVQKNPGRALHKIPGTQLISYISKENRIWEIRSLDPVSGATEKIVHTLPGVEDMCWLANGTMLMGKANQLYAYKPGTDSDWRLVHTFTDKHIYTITRLAVNVSSTMLALVAEASPEVTVDLQLEGYNKRDIDAFIATYADAIEIYNFPNQLLYKGKEQVREHYAAFFDATPGLHCEVKNRIVSGNKVIDEESLNINGRRISAVAIYEVSNGKIVKVTFIQ